MSLTQEELEHIAMVQQLAEQSSFDSEFANRPATTNDVVEKSSADGNTLKVRDFKAGEYGQRSVDKIRYEADENELIADTRLKVSGDYKLKETEDVEMVDIKTENRPFASTDTKNQKEQLSDTQARVETPRSTPTSGTGLTPYLDSSYIEPGKESSTFVPDNETQLMELRQEELEHIAMVEKWAAQSSFEFQFANPGSGVDCVAWRSPGMNNTLNFPILVTRKTREYEVSIKGKMEGMQSKEFADSVFDGTTETKLDQAEGVGRKMTEGEKQPFNLRDTKEKEEKECNAQPFVETPSSKPLFGADDSSDKDEPYGEPDQEAAHDDEIDRSREMELTQEELEYIAMVQQLATQGSFKYLLGRGADLRKDVVWNSPRMSDTVILPDSAMGKKTEHEQRTICNNGWGTLENLKLVCSVPIEAGGNKVGQIKDVEVVEREEARQPFASLETNDQQEKRANGQPVVGNLEADEFHNELSCPVCSEQELSNVTKRIMSTAVFSKTVNRDITENDLKVHPTSHSESPMRGEKQERRLAALVHVEIGQVGDREKMNTRPDTRACTVLNDVEARREFDQGKAEIEVPNATLEWRRGGSEFEGKSCVCFGKFNVDDPVNKKFTQLSQAEEDVDFYSRCNMKIISVFETLFRSAVSGKEGVVDQSSA
ncbi:unnamed protein product [Enterobius vermicularis]|uniref:ANK_REP_REGION domain-containing protein n=1 Tax=Enterobius vermicularis TaxID=51028 RepID=A0A0N4VN24_ENTVE|nr:unnamed protein product [Enterobius vermicularis]